MRTSISLLALAVIVLIGSSASSQWPSDPYVNLAIADRASEQVTPKVAQIPGGGCYVGWFDLSFGSYAVCLQRLDTAGREMWPHNGVTVSAHPQNSSLTDWALIADRDGNCVLTFADARQGSDLDVQAYRIAADGAQMWGPAGITLSSDNVDYEPQPTVTQASDGDFVFAWPRLPDAGGGALQMQRVSPSGELRFPVGGIAVVSSTIEAPAFPRLVPSSDGSAILVWVRDIHSSSSPRHLYAQRFSVAGAPVWPAIVRVYEAASVPMGYGPDIHTDEEDGVIVLWHAATGSMFNQYVQRVMAEGFELYTHNGLTVSTNSAMHHLDGSLAFNAETQEIFVVFNERNSAQSQWGVFGQKFNPDGSRAWGAGGIAFLPVNSTYRCFQRAALCGDGMSGFFFEDSGGGDRIRGFRADTEGHFVWPTSFVDVSTFPSNKGRLPIVDDGHGNVVLIWEDQRNDSNDVYGQNISADGVLGADPGTVPDLAGWTLGPNAPNPFVSSTRFTLPANANALRLELTDASGRVVRVLCGSNSLEWDGRDANGQPLPAGAYFYRALTSGGASEAGRAVLLR